MWPFRPKLHIISGDLFADLKAILDDSQARDEVYLISPYIKLEANIQRSIKAAIERDVKVMLLVRRGESIKQEENARFLANSHVHVKEMDHLHAKVFWTKRVAIVGSMNLHEHSDRNNIEIAVYFEKKSRINEIKTIIDGWWMEGTVVSPVELATAGKVATQSKSAQREGFCVACRDAISYVFDKPMCPKCWGVWKDAGSNRQRKEKYCHSCGKQAETTINTPLCANCK